jgi:uncharacterized membrane protein
MAPRYESPRTTRIVGSLLALVWLCVGIAAVIAGAIAQRWVLIPLGLFALWYGLVWVRVARQTRRLTLREALTPWRITHRSNADA